MRNPFTKLVNSAKNFFKGMKSDDHTPKNQKGFEKPVSYTGNKREHFPSWWTRLYRVGSRAKVGLLNRHIVKHQGSFKPIRRFNVPRVAFNKMFQIGRGLK